MFDGLISTVTIFGADLLRNIKGIRESQDLFDDLGESSEDYMVAIATECRDILPSDQGAITRPFYYGTVLTYPFIQENWQQTIFSSGIDYGVWYGSLDLETTIYETTYHWRRLVVDSFAHKSLEIKADQRVLKVKCQGIIISLLGKEVEWPAITDPNDYTFTNALGAYVKQQNQNGLLVKSARCQGTNAAIFTPDILSDARDYCFLSYIFSPADKTRIRVEREPGKLFMTV
jgi:hypothetical protein